MRRDQYLDITAWAEHTSRFPDSYIHGSIHWRAVTAQAIWLCDTYNLSADHRLTALLFGAFHDCRRHNEDYDPQHGQRAAEALQNHPISNTLSLGLLGTLVESLILHDGGQTTDDTLLGLGWDADRSLLGRVGMIPDHRFFSVVPEAQFDHFIEVGKGRHFDAPEWDILWAMAKI